MEKNMKLYEKLLKIQQAVDKVVKDGENKADKYAYVSGNKALETIRPKMNELGLLLIPNITAAAVREGQTRSGTTRFFTEVYYTFTWHDVESGEELVCTWYSQGADLGGERGVGKADTYAEKRFLLKFFHVPTDKDDPDNDGRTKSGELRQRGTQAARENKAYYLAAIPQMLGELYGGDAEKCKAAMIAMTKNDARGYPGVDDASQLSAAALPVAYAKIKKAYTERLGKEFVFTQEDEANANG